MTPFGEKVRRLRRERGLLLKDMAAHLGVSSAYLSALERGERGKPTWALVQGTLQYFNIIWDEADELARLADLSDPKIKIDTAATLPEATLLANRLAREIGTLSPEEIRRILTILDAAGKRKAKAAGTSKGRAISSGPDRELA
ncbi:helix-turn-helix domain-containing protein [Microvirga sp. 2MCAF38]|uniref:helix-turn-helix domain-containing protein n=1 Tax=Microvirga sp. 2MCAF38 TaxID=3232989 RepID=UPI003F9CF318